jgi:hypothetical protein
MSSCTKDTEIPPNETTNKLGSAISADGKEAIYEEILWGGAAGGITHCIRVQLPDAKATDDCDIMGTHLTEIQLNWIRDDVLKLNYCEGQFTNFTNLLYLDNAAKVEVLLEKKCA